jgi:hypothetical protein
MSSVTTPALSRGLGEAAEAAGRARGGCSRGRRGEGDGEGVVGWHPPYDRIGEGAPALSRGLGLVAEAPGQARGGVSR